MKKNSNKLNASMTDSEYKETIRIKCRSCGEDITENASKGAIPFVYGYCSFEHSELYIQQIHANKFDDTDWHWDGKHIILNKDMRDMLLRGLL